MQVSDLKWHNLMIKYYIDNIITIKIVLVNKKFSMFI